MVDTNAQIYMREGEGWVNLPGNASKISVGQNGTVYTINDYG
jgi:hypothetical protein